MVDPARCAGRKSKDAPLKRTIPLLLLAMNAQGSPTVTGQAQALAQAVMAKTDKEALEWCKKPEPRDYEWILETCMKIRFHSIAQQKDTVFIETQARISKRTQELNMKYQNLPEEERERRVLSDIKREFNLK